MRGTNKLELNQATMCAAVQHWLASVLAESTKVIVTTCERKVVHHGGPDEFVVTFDAAPEDGARAAPEAGARVVL